MLAHISYENYLSIKEDLMKEIKKDKTKGAIRKYLEYKYEASDIPEIYTYQKISLKNDIVDKIVKPTPPKEPKKLPKLQKDTKACKDDEEINPKTGKCVKKCKEDEIRNLETGRCNKIKPPKAPKQPKIPTIKK
jgi:hypothetical protein